MPESPIQDDAALLLVASAPALSQVAQHRADRLNRRANHRRLAAGPATVPTAVRWSRV
ncbi:MAG: hypothetical protein KTU85_08715 [Acidimicrobiia bacterium]|nr:hypothetical protein [Acidimicrobiia bacterium]MCY4456973.1 hypothetical protein [Acidimicrobiaceae bacterium]